MKTILRPALVLFAALTLLCGVLYPLAVTGLGQLLFPAQAHGSLVFKNGQPVGSILIGQAFSTPQYFWGRPSATTPMPNNGEASGGSNLGPSNPALLAAVTQRVADLKAADPDNKQPNQQLIPVDLVTASASGLDPEISLAAAHYQAARVATARHMRMEQVDALINQYSAHPYFGFIGEARINVLALNLALDRFGHAQ